MMELKKYVLLKGNAVIDTTKNYDYIVGGLFIEESGYLNLIKPTCEPLPVNYGEIVATSDNILDLARKGDLVTYKDIVYQLLEDDHLGLYFLDPYHWCEVECILLEEIKDQVTMLYKKVGNKFIGFEVK